jgi:lipoprotein-anchoring transpeptidase ErfK/SrfK
MTGWILSRLAMGATVAAVLTVQAMAQKTPEGAEDQKTGLGQSTHATKRVIVVSLEDRKLALVEDGQVKKVYTVAVGKPSTPSPVGEFTIARRVANPTYSHNGKVVPAGPGNPVGTRWMGLSVHGYGIHGTNEPRSIGKAASHGCIRMAKADLEDLYPKAPVGTAVELIGQRNEETARLFGPTPVIPAVQQPVLAQSSPVTAPAPAGDATGMFANAIAVVAAGTR